MASNILRNALAYKESHRQDALTRNRLAAFRTDQAEQERLNALNMDVGTRVAEGDLAGARDTAYRGGALDVGAKLDQHLRTLSAEDQKQFRDGIGIAATLVEKGLTGDDLAGAMRQFNFDDDDIAGIANLPEGALVAMRDHFAGRKGGVRASLNPVFGTDAQGNTVLLQPTETGEVIRSKVPEGITVSEPVRAFDTGTSFELRGTKTGQDKGFISKNVEEEKRLGARGQETGKREGEFPELKRKAENQLSELERQWDTVEGTIDEAIDMAEKGYVTGLWSNLAGVRGTPQYNLSEKLKTIAANIGFDKLQNMRENSPTGGAIGQVSNFEQKLLQAVQGSLEQGQTDDQLIANLETIKANLAALRSERRRAVARLEKDYLRAQEPQQDGAPDGEPSIDDLLRQYGGE